MKTQFLSALKTKAMGASDVVGGCFGKCLATGAWPSDGMCNPCIDTDGGENLDVKGETYQFLQTGPKAEDACVGGSSGSSGSKIKEYFCSNGVAKSKELNCGSDKFCSSGICQKPLPVIPIKCTDDDADKPEPSPKGMNTDKTVYYKGTTTLSVGDKKEVHTDSCVDKTKLTEWYCQNNSIKSKTAILSGGYGPKSMVCCDGAVKVCDPKKDNCKCP